MVDIQPNSVNFLDLPDVQHIITFGGWNFSTDPSTYMIFREGVTATYRGILAQNVANFVTENGLMELTLIGNIQALQTSLESLQEAPMMARTILHS